MKDNSAHSRIDGLEMVVGKELETIGNRLDACIQATNTIGDSLDKISELINLNGWHSAFITNIKAMNNSLSFLDPGDIQNNIQKLCEEHIRLSSELDKVERRS
jgi:hypothetical protein